MIKKITPTTNVEDKVNEYRQKLLNRIANSKEIFELIASDGQVFGEDDLIWKNIYPTEFIPETQETAQTFVCLDLDVDYTQGNDCFDLITIYIFVSTHMNTMRHPNGNGLRVDALTHEIRKLFDRQFLKGLGVKKCKFISNHRYNPTMQFRGRILCMTFEDFQYGV